MKEAKVAEEEVKKAAAKAKAIAESLRELDGKEIDFPPCEKGGMTALVGRISGQGVDDHCLTPVARRCIPAGLFHQGHKTSETQQQLTVGLHAYGCGKCWQPA